VTVGVTLQPFGTSLRTIGPSNGHSACSSMTLSSCFSKGKRTLVIVSLCALLTNIGDSQNEAVEDVNIYTCCSTMSPTISSSEDSLILGFSHNRCADFHSPRASHCVEDQLTNHAVLWPESDITKTLSCPIIAEPEI
jgi:hypothetical protein